MPYSLRPHGLQHARFPCPSYCKWCSNKHWGTCVFFIMVSSEHMPSSGTVGHMIVLFLGFKESPYCSPQWLYQFAFPPTVQEGNANFSIPSPAFILCRFFDDGHSHQCEVIPQYSFDLHFSSTEGCWDLFMDLLAICVSSLEKTFLFYFLFFGPGMQNLSPWPGIKPLPPVVEAQSLNHWTTREVPIKAILKYLIILLSGTSLCLAPLVALF